MSEWQDIGTAPRDGGIFLGFCAKLPTRGNGAPIATVRWYDLDEGRGCWWGTTGDSIVMLRPTHWMPLPAPPETA